MHIKIFEDDARNVRESHNQLHDDDDGLNHQSDMMRSIKMLVGGSGMTVKSNKNLVLDDNNGAIDLNQIKLSMPGGGGSSAQVSSLHKRGQSKVLLEEAKRSNAALAHEEEERNINFDELDRIEDEEDEEESRRRGDSDIFKKGG